MMKKLYLFLVIICLPLLAASQQKKQSLHGEWQFALDPLNVGEQTHWYSTTFPRQRWDKVNVPHCFSIDGRYQLYTGTAWYVRQFTQQPVPQGYKAFLRFEAVFYKSAVYVNGKKAGEHEGGYTPFEVDVTDLLNGENTLALKVNNAWDSTTIPGAKTRVAYENDNVGQVYPWINYGGINREVHLIIRPEVYVKRLKIVTDPDLTKKTAKINVQVDVAGAPAAAVTPSKQGGKKTGKAPGNVPGIRITRDGTVVPATFKTVGVPSAADGLTRFLLEATVAAKDVKLWNQDEPVLYKAEVVFNSDTALSSFGIRKIEVKGTSLLLNGESVRMGGCNRPLDYPGHGSMDPAEVLDKDLTLIKSGGMELSRISHYPVSTQLLDWADAHGLLIIAEPGNWQMTPKQMSDPVMRAKFQAQFTEMMERDWNHPSVIAWSVGNEYPSQTPEGRAWTKDMIEFGKQHDASRLYTFASMIVWRDFIKAPEEEASQYVDFVSANIYGDHLKHLKHIHELYPNKPVYVSEFGLRTDGVKNEQDRENHLSKAMQDFRQCDFLVGASIWTFNDYQSRFPGTNPSGYRPWGLVSPEREIRGMYVKWQEEFSPATVVFGKDASGKTTITVTARNDFPRYTMRHYQLQCAGETFDIAELKPGESKTFVSAASTGEVRLIKPGGFTALKTNIQR
ncbi:glycoside hydrolase family 2 TIM barrel-domain containing protein [Chryseolinea sp. T2]|uniref:glycoside hydrolase family 2 protein n=1 Tax=Chryseolinea sp. T2 TaxID=3129255 RepID=UPI003078A149